MISIMSVQVGNKTCLGVRIELPDSPPLLAITADKGFVMRGFLNVEAAERLGVCAAMVSGVKTFEDVLNAQIKAMISKAKSFGVKVDMTAAEALQRMC